MSGAQQHKYSTEKILADYVILDVVCVMFHTEGKQLKNQAEKLCSLIIICKTPINALEVMK